MEQLKAITTSRPVKASEAMKNAADYANSEEGCKQFVFNKINDAANKGEYSLTFIPDAAHRAIKVKKILKEEGFRVDEWKDISECRKWCKVSWDTPIGG